MAQRIHPTEIDNELIESVLREKTKGTSDFEIGQKFGLTYRTLERIITQSKGINVSSFKEFKKVKKLHPKGFSLEKTTIWSFKQRGDWATHSGEYRGNWSPYIPRNLILRYSKPGELVLDYFCGAGTTAVECKLLGRKCIGIDINEKAIELARKNVSFTISGEQMFLFEETGTTFEPELIVGDARNLSIIPDNSVDLICSHPPYANIIHYTNNKVGDLSFLSVEDFLKEMSKVAQESYRVLKPGRQCAILIGDTRKRKYVIPLGFNLINVFLKAGFRLRELVIKRQHNCKTTGFWYDNSVKHNFLLLAHEYLPIFEKPIHSTFKKKRKTFIPDILPVLEKCEIPNKSCRLETTTVWLFPKDDLEIRLLKNIVGRYSEEANCILITLSLSGSRREPCSNLLKEGNKEKKLVYMKLPYLNADMGLPQIENMLKKAKDILEKVLSTLSKGSFIVVHAKDVRVDGYIFPSGKEILETFNYGNIKLKEIVIVNEEPSYTEDSFIKDHLEIAHSYLLVYEAI